MQDHVEFFRSWARDIRASSGPSADADQIEAAADEIENLRRSLAEAEADNARLREDAKGPKPIRPVN